MKEEGKLDRGTLISVIDDKVTARQWGFLFIESEDYKSLLHISNSGIELVADSSSRWEVEHLLVQRGLLSEQQLQKAKRIAKETHKDLKPVITEQGFATQDQFENAVRKQAREKLLDAFLRQEGTYEFRDEDRRSEVDSSLTPPFKFVFDHQEILDEAKYRLSEFETQKTLIDPSERYGINEEYLTSPEDVETRTRLNRIVQQVKQARSVREIAERLNYSIFETYKTLTDLSMEGALRPLTEQEMLEAARDHFEQRENLHTCIRLFKRYLNENPGDMKVRSELADALITAGKETEAAELLLDTAKKHLSEYRKQKARNLLKKAYEMDPDNREIQKIWFETVLDLNEPKRIRETGEELIHSHIEAGNLEAAQDVLHKLLERFPHSIRLLMTGADLAWKQGKSNQVQTYISRSVDALPKDLSTGSREAVDYLKKSTRNPDELDPYIKTAVGYSSPFFSVRTFVLALLLLFIGGGLFVVVQIQRNTQKVFMTVDDKARLAIRSGNLEEGVHRYEQFVQDYPYSYKRFTATERINELQKRIHNKKQSSSNNGSAPSNGESVHSSTIREKLATIRDHYLNSGDNTPLKELEDQLISLKKSYEGPLSDDIHSLLQKIEQDRNTAQTLLRKAVRLTDDNEIKEARKLFTKLRKKYPRSEAVKEIFYPVRITTTPPSVKLYIDNKRIGETPLTHRFSSVSSRKLTAVQPHFENKRLTIMPGETAELNISLTKKFSWEKDVSSRITAGPVPLEDGLLVGTAEGYLWYGSYDRHEYWSSTLETDQAIQFLVASSENSCFAVMENGQLIHLDPVQGKILWEKQFPKSNLHKPTVDPKTERLFFSAGSRNVYTIDLKTGNTNSTVTLPSAPASSVFQINGRQFVLTKENHLLELDPARSTTKNSFQPISGPDTNIRRAWVLNNEIWMINGNGHVLRVQPIERTSETVVQWNESLFPQLHVLNTHIYFATENGSLFQWKRKEGTSGWKRPLGEAVTAGPVFNGNLICVVDRSGTIYAFHPANGLLYWTRNIPFGVPVTELRIRKQNLMFGTDEGYLYMMKLASFN